MILVTSASPKRPPYYRPCESRVPQHFYFRRHCPQNHGCARKTPDCTGHNNSLCWTYDYLDGTYATLEVQVWFRERTISFRSKNTEYAREAPAMWTREPNPIGVAPFPGWFYNLFMSRACARDLLCHTCYSCRTDVVRRMIISSRSKDTDYTPEAP